MNQEIQRTARYLLFTPILAVMLFLNTAGPVNASAGAYVPGTETPISTPEPTKAVTPSAMPRLNGDHQYVPTPPPLVRHPVPVTGVDTVELTPEDWKAWPVLPVEISAEMQQLYQQGVRNGTDPKAFSIIGDCQSQPEVFMAVFDTDPDVLAMLPPYLRETADHFSGSFARNSPTVRDGITAGAVLWTEWANKYHQGLVCQPGETPLTCELRVNNPSIVFIHIGTHWETRNHRYLTLIVETIKEHGAVPVMVTKADNREGDERINLESVRVAQEQGIPVWNFWASVQDTPNNGLENNNAMYLNEEAVEIHRYSALQVLDKIWRAVK
jgi:hypothetical protein